MLIGEIKKDGFGWSIDEWREDDRRTVLALDEFLQGFGYDVDEWENDPFIVQDKAKIGGSYWRFVPPKKAIEVAIKLIKEKEPKKFKKKDLKALEEKEKEVLSRWLSDHKTRFTEERLRLQTQSHINNITSLSSSLASHAQNLTRLRRVGLNEKDFRLTDFTAFQALLNEGFYRYLGLEGEKLRLITKEVFLSEVNEAAKLDLRVNLGEFEVQVYLGDFHLEVRPYRQNVRSKDYYHPHIAGGTVCFGDAYNQYVDHCNNGDLVGVLRLLQQLFHNYNPGSAYRGLDKFVEEAKRKDERRREIARLKKAGHEVGPLGEPVVAAASFAAATPDRPSQEPAWRLSVQDLAQVNEYLSERNLVVARDALQRTWVVEETALGVAPGITDTTEATTPGEIEEDPFRDVDS